APNTTASRFSIKMLDFGDWNPTHSAYHEIQLIAYDTDWNLVDADILSFTNTPIGLPPETNSTGDACNAQPGDPGNYTFHVQGAGITWLVLQVTAGLDPHI